MKREKKINLFLVIFFGIGILGLGWEASRSFFIRLMPFSLLLGMGLMFWVHKHWKPLHVGLFLLIVVLGFGVEVAGVLTGEVFGSYSYGRALGFKLWGTPPMIGLNWLMLVYAVYVLLRKMPLHPFLQIPVGAGLMVVYDVIMEPVAMQLDMWDWGGGVIPLQNYIAWFVISLVMLSIFHIARLRIRNGVAPVLFFIQIGLFLVLNIWIT
ncbi:MAG: carotenoid biosynthesis protein [Bacteroidota bacterium]